MSGSVLCAVDLANGADDADTIRVAADLAAQKGSQLDVIAVVPDYGMSPVGTYFNKEHHDEAVEASKQQLNDLVTEAIGADANESVRHVVATGRAYAEVLNLAEQTQPWLIVVGAHKSEVSDFLLGPNAARIVRHSKTSVYVVR